MTDLATRPDAEGAPIDDATEPVTADAASTPPSDLEGDASAPSLAWAPSDPAPRKRHLALWIGIPAGIAAVGLVASSLVLIAPGTSVAGVPIGGLTPGAAADAIQNRLAETTIVLTGAGGDVEVTGADLGASVDARELADSAFSSNPMWNPTTWFGAPADADVTIDSDAANSVLRAAAPDLYTDPVDSSIALDPATASFVATPSVDGSGIDLDAVRSTLETAFAAGQVVVEMDATFAPVEPTSPTSVAEATVQRVNAMLDSIGFYVGAERTVPIDRAVAASWLTIAPAERGTYSVTADEAAIQQVVDSLPAAINREPVNATSITDSSGGVLREETVGVVGRSLDSTDGIASGFAEQLESFNSVYGLPVTEVPFATTALARRIEVNLSEQHAYLFENENVIDSWPISSGTPGNDSDTGYFRINAKLRTQNMGNPDLTKAPNYYTENVPWVMYYNGDEALHGAYWHNNFGNTMSHGCINMPLGSAEFAYAWAPMGTEVWVHY